MFARSVPIFFIFGWILPVAWVGLLQSDYPLYPSWIDPLFRVSGIFESGPERWGIFFIERKEGADWCYVDERSLFAPSPLGDRTRFQQLMNRIEDSNSSDQVPQILHWIELHSPRAKVVSSRNEVIRIVEIVLPAETFFKNQSLNGAYNYAVANKVPRKLIGSTSVP